VEVSARRPNLFIVGAPKCGTTAWVHYLSSHPDIFFSPVKEPHYFCTDFPNFRHVKTESEYLALFAAGADSKVLGEASVRYLHSRDTARNIRQYNPDARILIFVRDQQDYLPAQHNQMVFNKLESILDFETAWRLSGKRDASNMSPTCSEPRFLDYAQCAGFSEHVERYFDQFPEDQVRVFHFRDWSREPRATYLEILRFLGLEDDGRTNFPRINQASRRRTTWLWRLQRFRPAPLRTALDLVRRLTGRRSLGIGDLLGRLDTQQGSVSTASDALRAEIAARYKEDNALLERRIWSPATAPQTSER
jgi:hypothetical protein